MKKILFLIAFQGLTLILCANTYSILNTNFENGKIDRKSESVTNIPNLISDDGFFSLNFLIPPPVIDSFSPASGCMEDQIAIYGSGLTDVTSVFIGGINSVFTINNDNDITATVGPGTTTGFVVVTNSVDTATSAVMFYLILPPSMPGAISGTVNPCSFTVQTYTISPVNGATYYFWQIPSTWTGTSTTTSITVTVGTMSGNIHVSACDTCCSDPQSLMINVFNLPATPCPIYPDSFAMAGNVITYWVDSVAGATSYTWTLPSGWTGFSVTDSITVTVGSGSGNVCVVANIACGSSGACCMAISVVNCYAAFNLYADTSILHHYFITDTIMGVQPLHYLWSWGDGNYDSIPFPSHTYADSGIYTICLTITDSTGCQSTYCDSSYHIMRTSNYMVTVNVISNIMTSTNSTNTKNEISIYPNPAKNTITIHQSTPSSNQQLLITNILGEEIYHQPINNSNKQTIDVSQWSNGVYFYQIRNDKETLQGKFVKQ